MRQATARTTVERDGRSAVVHLHGDLVIPTARRVYGELRGVAKRRDVQRLVIDFSQVGRLDSAGVAVVALVERAAKQGGKTVELAQLGEQHRATFALTPESVAAPPDEPRSGLLETLGERVLVVADGLRAFALLVIHTVRQLLAVATRRERVPAGSIGYQVATMGVDALFIVGLLSFLTGMTMAFEGAIQLQRFGAGVFVADMLGLTMVRELAPLMTAIVLTGRTGAAIAAELGTMRVRSEIDALETMGIDPVRFLIVPRIAGITIAGPALTIMGTFIGILGGMLVARLAVGLPAVTFWNHVVDRVTIGDFVHGIAKSFAFAWIIGFTGSHLGLRASSDASSVGSATTRSVVIGVFCIVLVDAIFAIVSTMTRYG